MKHLFSLIAMIAISFTILCAQVPQAFNYTGIALDSKGKAISNKNLSILAEILDGSSTGPSIYSEIHNVSTDNNGFFSIQIGGAGLPDGSLPIINWSESPKYFAIAIDYDGSGIYQEIGEAVQLLSVPFALYGSGIFAR